jgi:hypothetical protein
MTLRNAGGRNATGERVFTMLPMLREKTASGNRLFSESTPESSGVERMKNSSLGRRWPLCLNLPT